MKKLCVFCGSACGKGDQYMRLGKELGRMLAQNNIGLVYGGAISGVMGALADSVLAHKGLVWGVIPQMFDDKEIAHQGLTELITTSSIQERKQQMYQLSDGFLALPGGMGTMDELCEVLARRQINLHQAPCYILNYKGYYDNFLDHIQKMVDSELMKKEYLQQIIVKAHLQEVIEDFIGRE